MSRWKTFDLKDIREKKVDIPVIEAGEFFDLCEKYNNGQEFSKSFIFKEDSPVIPVILKTTDILNTQYKEEIKKLEYLRSQYGPKAFYNGAIISDWGLQKFLNQIMNPDQVLVAKFCYLEDGDKSITFYNNHALFSIIENLKDYNLFYRSNGYKHTSMKFSDNWNMMDIRVYNDLPILQRLVYISMVLTLFRGE